MPFDIQIKIMEEIKGPLRRKLVSQRNGVIFRTYKDKKEKISIYIIDFFGDIYFFEHRVIKNK